MFKALLLFLALSHGFLFAQTNLVLNPSFEDMILCPPFMSSFDGYVANWNNPTNGSPDYFCTCSSGSAGVPGNLPGYQFPRSGNCYAGFGVGLEHPSIDRREYIQGILSTPLESDSNYCIEYFVALSNRSTIGLERLGVYFSIGSSFFNTISVLPVTPSGYSTGTFFTDTLNWQKVQMEYIAVGGETHFILGNLLDSTNSPYQPIVDDYLDTVPMSPGWNYMAGCYYYIDDVSIFMGTCPIDDVEPIVFVPDAFSPNGDGNNDVLFVRGDGIASIHFRIYDRWGEEVFYTQDLHQGWDGRFKGKALNSGVFAYTLHVVFRNGKEKDYTGNLTLVR
jgi:gliding motility-associated-like protein